MKRFRRLAALLVLAVVLTACSRGSTSPAGDAATTGRATAPEAESSPATSAAKDPSAPAAAPTAKTPQASVPVHSVRMAFARVKATAEAQKVLQRLGTKAVMVNMQETAEAYSVSIGENFPERVRFEAHHTVNKADGSVMYMDIVRAEERPATMVIPPRDPAVDQAEAMLGRGETKAAIELLTKASASKPTADTWNLLSYGHLLSGDWAAASEAGQKALKLDADHPYAMYNTGMAQIELKQYVTAIQYLLGAAEMQPERAEPYLGLARAYQESGHYALAMDALADALRLAPGDAGAKKLQAAVDGMVKRTSPADLTAAKVKLEDGAYSIYLFPGAQAYVYLKGPDGFVGLPVGKVGAENWTQFRRLELPGGAVGYLLPGESIGAYVANSVAGRLFVRTSDGQFRQVVFYNHEPAWCCRSPTSAAAPPGPRGTS